MRRFLRLQSAFMAITAFMLFFSLGSSTHAQTTDPAPYCASVNNWNGQTCTTYFMGIGEVIIENAGGTVLMDRVSDCNGTQFYTNYTDVTPPLLTPGQTYTYRVKSYPGMTVNYTNNLNIWIDWDGNGVFSDAGIERIPEGRHLGVGVTLVGTFTVPSTGFAPNMRMRLSTYNSYTTLAACGNYNYGETEDYTLQVGGGGIKGSYPTGNSVLLSGNLYNGAPNFPKPSLLISRTFAPLTQRISRFRFVAVNAGALTPGTVVYEVLDPVTYSTTITNFNNATDPFTITAAKAQGMATNGLPPANVGNDGSFVTSNIPAGTYRLEAVHDLLNGTTVIFSSTYTQDFFIALSRDLSCSSIESPLPSNRQRYLRTYTLPVRAIYKNVGVETITRYRAIAEIRRAADNSVIRKDTVIRSTDVGGGLPAGGLISTATDEVVLIPNFVSNQADSFNVICRCELLETVGNPFAQDQQASNDMQPRTGNYMFTVWYLIDFETRQILSPATTGTYAGRAFTVSALFANNGLGSDPVPALLNITYNGTPVVTNQQIMVDVTNSSGFNTQVYSFPSFTPLNGGQYNICVKVLAPGDEYNPNDEKCLSITVGDRLIGTYTIGTTTKPGIPSFPTIETAVDALYRQGVRGSVVFQLTDPFYSVGNSGGQCNSALDLTSRIIGMDANNTVTWIADPQGTGLSKAGVTIQLNSCNGIGINLGQRYLAANPNAIQADYPSVENANSPGYMTFDGGKQKSLKFLLKTYANRRAVFYLGQRSYNNTIKNCLIEMDPSTPELDFWSTLPGVTIESNAFKFGPDSAGFGGSFATYTAGIFQRNRPPANDFGNNVEKLDTAIVENNITYLGNKANKFIGNEIRGFAYGIASIGIGTLKKNSRLTRYYNTQTEIRDNVISKIRRAGIFLGYEDGAKVTGNKIFDVGITATGKGGEANGIEAGGQNSLLNLGFNNINCEISRNEINGVTSDVFARGVKVQQSLNDLSSVVPPPGEYLQPSVAESMDIMSNMVWGLSRTIAGASRTGIHILTDRNGASGINGQITARISNYFTRKDTIANNTIFMSNDNISNSGGVVGIALQHGMNSTIMNNAIAMTGTNTTADIAGGYPHAAMFYQGLHPKYVGGLMSDRNAIWSPNAATVRFVEIDSISQTLLAGYQDEYQTLAQWKAWTKQDLNTLTADFTNDYVISGSAPIQYYRVKKNPAPTGSILNNRGTRLANVIGDIDGEARGSAGQAYDIGADEFGGVSYVNDVEVTTILSPRSYRSGASQVSFADAEHLMVNSDVKVIARLRNNGSITQVVSLVGEYAVENAASSGNSLPSYPGFSGLLNGNQTVQIAAGESKDVEIGTLQPQSLSQLGSSYTTPVWMQRQVDSSMRVNVTPRYKIQARVVTPDENVTNNSDAIDARFYIRRSNLKMMTSWVGKSYNQYNAAAVTTDPQYARNTIARLNADSLKRGIDSLGVTSGLTPNTALASINYDIMDRDGWEQRAVDYTWYRSLIWSNDNTGLGRFQRDNIREFVASSNIDNAKKNLLIASQELVKFHVGLNAINDEYFPRYILRAQRGKSTTNTVVTTPVAAGYAMPPIVLPSRSDVTGITVGRGITETIKRTGFTLGTFSDPLPLPALMSVYVDATTQGLARPAYKYTTKDATAADTAMGIAVSGTGTNVIYLGTDWRHFGKLGNRTGVERVLRSSIDYFDNNDGNVVPVELTEFNATATGKSVNVYWTTASEQNSAWFDVERKEATGGFTTVATIPAAGTSTNVLNYGIKDADVQRGMVYVYRLKSVDKDGKYGYSAEVEVAVGGVSGMEIVEANANTVTYSITASGTVELGLYDLMGRKLGTLDNNYREAGTYSVPVTNLDLSSGMYQLILKVGGETATGSMQIVK